MSRTTATRPVSVTASHPYAQTLQTFTTASGAEGAFYSLPALARRIPNVARLPVSLRIVLESVLRHCDGRKVSAEHVEQLARWQPNAERSAILWFNSLHERSTMLSPRPNPLLRSRSGFST